MNRLFILFLLFAFPSLGQIKPQFLLENNDRWVDSVFNTLSLDEKIGQILMPRANFSGQPYESEKLKQWVKDYKLGGFVFFAGPPTVQARVVNELQSVSKVPLMIGVDMEWGLAMRLDSTVRFPYQLALGAMQGGDDLIYRMGVEVGKQAKRMGIHINYAPVVDINNNPKNPVINFRSFGEDKYSVANKALAYMKGMQSQNLLVSAKHFPGHGDTGVDSHYDLPVISHSKEHLKNNELFPFKYLVENGLSGVMTAHLNIPSLEKTANLASTFSSSIITDLLKKDMGFSGLIFTDAMDMQGAVKNFKPGEAMVKAVLAGNDVLETFIDVPTAFAALKNAVLDKTLPESILNERVKKVLKAKAWVGLNDYKPIVMANLIEDLNTRESDFLNRTFAEKTLIALKTSDFPVKDLTKPLTVVSLGAESSTYFQQMTQKYVTAKEINIGKDTGLDVLDNLPAAGTVVVGLHLGNIRPGAKYGLEPYMLTALEKLENATLVIFGNPYVLDNIPNIQEFPSVLMANQLTKYTEEAAAMAVFGAIDVNGRLPVTVNADFKYNAGIWVQNIGRLAYGTPEMAGIDGKLLEARIDSVVNLGLNEKAYPGAVVEVAQNGRVIYQKAFGYHTYEDANLHKKVLKANQIFEVGNQSDAMDNPNFASSSQANLPNGQKVLGAVNVTDLYDLASVTKITTSALAVMQLMSDGRFDLDKKFADYYPEYKGSNKENLTFRDMLTHRSGLKAWIPFWMDCIDSVSTMKKALELNTGLEEFYVKDYKKQGFFARLFKAKPKYTLNFDKTLESSKEAWLKSLSPESITWKPGIFSNKKDATYSIEIADTLFMNADRVAFIYNQIKESPVKVDQGYVYSDLHYYTYPMFMEKLTGIKWEDYLKKTYAALGASSLTYNPTRFYSLSQIVPTERDTLFRKTLIHGRVHDEGAGMLNGVSGHAGLFGNANDVTKLMQMYLQGGSYGGQEFIKPEVLAEATRYQFPEEGSRRGIAFDKPDFNPKILSGPRLSSKESFGHSGYTGTFAWVDPKYKLVYTFLSNRVYPTRDNSKISTLNLRTAIGDEVIRTIKEKK